MREIFQITDKLIWGDFISPNADDLKFIKQFSHFHPITMDEITHFSSRSKVSDFDGYFYIVSYLPVYDSEKKCAKEEEIDILVTAQQVFTIHYSPLEVINEFKDIVKNRNFKVPMKKTYHLLYSILEKISDYSLRQLLHIEEKVDIIGEKLFAGKERELLEQISLIKRDLSFISLSLVPQRVVLNSLLHTHPKLWKDQKNETKMYFADLVGDYNRVTNLYKKLKESLDDFDQTNAQLLNYKINEVMKIFTVLAFVILPLVTLLSFLQINFINDWITGKPLVIIGLFLSSIIITFLLIFIFRRKKWL